MKTALVTGGNRGIGLETAAQLAKLGFSVIIGSREAAKGQEAVKKLQERGISSVDCVQLDVESEESVKQAAQIVHKKFNGKLDALINNAGYSSGPCESASTDIDAVRRCMEANLYGTMRVTNHFLDMVKKSDAGRIVNVSSIMGSMASGVCSLPTTAYCTSKAALNMYTVNLADALRGTPIKVNAGHPGWVKTDMGGSAAPLEVTEGAETSVYLATLPADGPTGGLFFKKDRLPW